MSLTSYRAAPSRVNQRRFPFRTAKNSKKAGISAGL